MKHWLKRWMSGDEACTRSISVILATAREDYPIIGLPQIHMLEPTIESLKIQTFQDFELIVVDALHAERPGLFQEGSFRADRLPFPVRHVPIASDHRFWADRRRWNVCGSLNTGILHANGELLVRIDDCSEFDESFLRRFWQGYQEGFWPCAMHIRFLEGKPARLNDRYREIGLEASYQRPLKELYGENGLVRDTRYDLVKKEGGRKIGPPEWFYGYSSMPLSAALKVNGFDELFDGNKGLEDCDMGSRLSMAGFENKFLLDVDHQVIEHEHKSIPERLIDSAAKPIKCNYSIYLLHRNQRKWKANSKRLSTADIDFVRRNSLEPPCTPAGSAHMYEDDCQGPTFDLWARHQPRFDLREERRTRR